MDRALLQLLRAKDLALPGTVRREAFGHVVAEHQDAAFAVAYSILGDATTAQDAALEGFVEAWRKLDSLRDPEAFGGWLRSLVRTHALRHLRASKRFTAEALGEEPLSSGGVDARRIALWHALGALPERERESVVLFYIAGLSREEIGQLTGSSTVSVKKRLARALAKLREETIEMDDPQLKSDLPSHNEEFRRKALLLAGRFAELLSSRRPILLALDDCIAEAGNGPVDSAFREMKDQVLAGKAMADAMRRHPNVFDSADASAVLFGEERGILHDVLRRIAEGQRFESRESLESAFRV